jgi:hypothetical protein
MERHSYNIPCPNNGMEARVPNISMNFVELVLHKVAGRLLHHSLST